MYSLFLSKNLSATIKSTIGGIRKNKIETCKQQRLANTMFFKPEEFVGRIRVVIMLDEQWWKQCVG